MSKLKSFEEYKEEMVNHTFGWLTILDVFRDESNHRLCKCKCKCGNIVIKDMKKVYSGHTTSCGCYNKSEEKRNKLKQSWENNPDRKEKQADKLTQYYIDHPEKAKEISEKLTSFYKDNHDKSLERGKKYSEWVIDNYDKVLEIGKCHSLFYKNNPDVAKTQGEKISLFYKENPNKLKERSLKRSDTLKNNPHIQETISEKNAIWRNNNPEKLSEIAYKNSEYYKLLRSLTDYSLIINYVDPSQVNDLLSGNLDSSSLIRTKCPICGKYSEHTLHNIFRIKTQDLKFGSMPMCKECYNSFTITSSKYEQDIAEIVSSFYNGKCIRNDRTILNGKELDLYYPEKKIAIEFNGDYWHSEQCNKNKLYHFNKFKLCKENNIRLISIFEHDWVHKRDKVILVLKNAFSNNIELYARKCIIKSLSYKEKSNFINKYHFDGDSYRGNISYGLYYNNELVSCMSFGSLRGQNKLRLNHGNYELIRFVTKDGYNIIGGASKLFKHFIIEHNPNYILCYSDNDLFTGDVYKNLGFSIKSLGESSIDYVWVNQYECRPRYKTMSKKLLDEFPQYKDISITGSKEKYIMEDLGYKRIYRCGNSIYEWFSK